LRRRHVRGIDRPTREKYRLVFAIKSFNAFALDESMKVLLWRRTAENPEDFPTFVRLDEVLKARRGREQEQPASEDAGRPSSDEAEHVAN
jgi:hypothetical protein